MPTYMQRPEFDPANIASKLPRPLQRPAGMALGALKEIFPQDDPLGGLSPVPMESMVGPMAMAAQRSKPFAEAVVPKTYQEAMEYVPEFQPWQGAKDVAEYGKRAVRGLRNFFDREPPSMPTPMPRPSAPMGPALREPKPGGVLHDVLSRAGEKAGMGEQLTPGESRLFSQYSPTLPPNPRAKYLGMQEGAEAGESFPLFNVEGGESSGSTVGIDTLRKLGIPVPNYAK